MIDKLILCFRYIRYFFPWVLYCFAYISYYDETLMKNNYGKKYGRNVDNIKIKDNVLYRDVFVTFAKSPYEEIKLPKFVWLKEFIRMGEACNE